MAPQTLLVEQLQKGRSDKRIIIRASRIWRAYNTRKFRDLMSMDFLGIDTKGQGIHCVIRSKFIPNFEGLFTIGNVYSIKNFTIGNAKPLFCVVPRDLLILLDASTFVEEIVKDVPRIPRHIFTIIPYDMLLKASDDKRNLCDIIGYVVGVSEVGHRMSYFQEVAMQYIDIQNTMGDKLRITFWGDEVINMICMIKESNQRVWLIASAIAKIESNGSLGVSSSSATYLYNDIDIPEIADFINKLGPEERNSEMGNITMQATYITKEEYDPNKLLIREVNEVLARCETMKKPLYVYGSVSKIEEVNGWKYNSCTRCKKKVYPQDGKLYCNECKEYEMYPLIRYRVEAELHDGTESLNCVMFDREIEKLINIKKGYAEPVPRHLRNIIEKCHVFQLEFDELSRGTNNESFTVKRILFESDIRDPATNNENTMKTPPSSKDISVRTHSVNEKRNLTEISEHTSAHNEDGSMPGSVKGKDTTALKKAKRGLEFGK